MTKNVGGSIRFRQRIHMGGLFVGVLASLMVCSFLQTQIHIFVSSFRELTVGQKSLMYTTLALLLWVTVAVLVTIVYGQATKAQFGIPLRKLCEAISKVAGGDFSVRLSANKNRRNSDYIFETYENFNAMVGELANIETMRTGFVADVSHDIKTPLAVIQGHCSMLLDRQLGADETKEVVQRIVRACRRLEALTSNVLQLNKLEHAAASDAVSQTRRFDLSGQLAECVLSLSDAMEGKRLQLYADIEDRCFITANDTMLDIVWQNLLDNAIKFSDEGGTITLTQHSTPDSVTVSIADTGCGMSPETLRHAFDKFYRGDPSRFSQGNGLGLALCKRAVSLAGGTIRAESQEDVGSTFTVTLPVREGQASAGCCG